MNFTVIGQSLPQLSSSHPQPYIEDTPHQHKITVQFELTTLKSVSIKNHLCSNIEIQIYKSDQPKKKHDLGQFFDTHQTNQFLYNILINQNKKYDRLDILMYPNAQNKVGIQYLEIIPKSKKNQQKQTQQPIQNKNVYGNKPPDIDNSFFDKSYSNYHFITKDPVGRRKKDEWEFLPQEEQQINSQDEEEQSDMIIQTQYQRELELDRKLDAKQQMFQLKASDIGQHFWDKHISLERDRGLLMSQRLMRCLNQ